MKNLITNLIHQLLKISLANCLAWLQLAALSLGTIAGGNNLALANARRLGHSILNSVDSNFNPQISTTTYSDKAVHTIIPTGDGKILVAGRFNLYNGNATTGLIKINTDGSADTNFNNNLFYASADNTVNSIVPLPDGKILIGGRFTLANETAGRSLVRLNSDGSVDTSFAYNNAANSDPIEQIRVRSNGKILLRTAFVGTSIYLPKHNKIFQINSDGTLDPSFDSAATDGSINMALQGDKLVISQVINNPTILRLNGDGSVDASFNPFVSASPNISDFLVQPSGKIVVVDNVLTPHIFRLNENGGVDPTFQDAVTARSTDLVKITMLTDGSLIVATYKNYPDLTVIRLTPDGALNPTFASFVRKMSLDGLAVQPDGKVLLGDQSPIDAGAPSNNFVRLNNDGSLDSSFNTGAGFQQLNPGVVQAIITQQDGKILIGGRFDLVNNINRNNIARLNADGTLDNSFVINTAGANSFARVSLINSLTQQPDGKIIIAGAFQYTINGVYKQDFARLNADGSLDTAFNLGVRIDYGGISPAAHKAVVQPDGKILVVTSTVPNYIPFQQWAPLRLNSDGSRDASFNPNLFPNAGYIIINDLFLQPNGKIVVGGSYSVPIPGSAESVTKSFVVRLSTDGTIDSSFQAAQEINKEVRSFVPLSNGQIIVGQNSEVIRLNANGSLDGSFNDGTGAVGNINILLGLPNGNILVGGRFSQFNGQPRQNLAVLNSDGSLDATTFNTNQEVSCLTIDNKDRVLVGGTFTVISGEGNNFNRSYIARLIGSNSVQSKTGYDFDGDGRADSAVFNLSTGVWSVMLSKTNQTTNIQFGLGSDLPVPADYDNDGKTDIAVWRPSNGVWYLQQSTNGFAVQQWGLPDDKPVPADYDGDGKADIAVWRPSTGTWYIIQSSNGQAISQQFGKSGDIPLVNVDFDGDGRADIAVYRPSNGTWYWLASNSGNSFQAVQWGLSDDVPVPGDYNGDGKTDLTVFRPSNGIWYQLLSTPNGEPTFSATQFGLRGDVPVAADYDGDGRADIAVRRGSTWYLQKSTAGFAGFQFGPASDSKPIEAVFLAY